LQSHISVALAFLIRDLASGNRNKLLIEDVFL
jgi:hypothetical protein